MNLWKRFTTFWPMLAHLLQNPTHVEELWSSGPIVFGVHIGIRFDWRRCGTCGYRP